jgi:DNA adenine methylase
VDPPYVTQSRVSKNTYGKYEVTDDFHVALAKLLNNTSAYVASSGYHDDMMDEIYGDWYVSEEGYKQNGVNHTTLSSRNEVLWTNYHPQTFEKIK